MNNDASFKLSSALACSAYSAATKHTIKKNSAKNINVSSLKSWTFRSSSFGGGDDNTF